MTCSKNNITPRKIIKEEDKMKKALSLLMAMLMLFSLAACGGGGGTTTSTPPATSGTTSTPPAGSGTTDTPKEPSRTHLNYALTMAIVGLDPQGTGFSKTASLQLYKWIYDPLVDVTDDAEVYGCLAESWTVSADGLTYVFKLRPNVKFHSGNTMTAKDVAFTLNRAAKEMANTKSDMSSVDTVEATGDLEVTVKLKEPNNAFLYFLSKQSILEQATVEKEGDNFGNVITGAGTGAWKITSYEPNSLIKMEKFADYWNKENTGNIETMDVHIISNSSTRITALQTGEIDFTEIPVANFTAVKDNKDLTTFLVDSTKTTLIHINYYRENSPLNDKRVRQAMRYALNLDAIVKVAANGLGTVAYTIGSPKLAGIDDTDFKDDYPYNPEKAKELLKEAGYADGVTLPNPILFISSNASTAQMLQEMWAAVGIKINLEQAESATASAQSKKGYHDVYITNSSYLFHMALMRKIFHSAQYSTAVAKYNFPELDECFEKGEAAVDEKERDQWYYKANTFLADQCITIPLYYMHIPYGWAKDLDAEVGAYYNTFPQYWNWTV